MESILIITSKPVADTTGAFLPVQVFHYRQGVFATGIKKVTHPCSPLRNRIYTLESIYLFFSMYSHVSGDSPYVMGHANLLCWQVSFRGQSFCSMSAIFFQALLTA